MIKTFGLAAGFVAVSSLAASAAFIDFTDEDQGLSGSFGNGVFYTVVGTLTTEDGTEQVNDPMFNQDTPVGEGVVLPAPLAGDFDGLGIGND